MTVEVIVHDACKIDVTECHQSCNIAPDNLLRVHIAALGMFYKELYYTPERRILDPKVQELISIAASLVAKCEGCIDGHIKKAMALGATKEEISETICIAVAINAAAVVDFSDQSASRLGLSNFPTKPAPAR